MAEGWLTRRIAGQLVFATVFRRQSLDDALRDHPDFELLEGPDRGFARAMTSAALRWRGRLRGVASQFLDRPMDQLDGPVQCCLEIGLAQLLVMGISPHAAVGETVEAARAWKPASKGGGLVNAILRRASEHPEALQAIGALDVWPDWLAARLSKDLGEAGAIAMAEHQLDQPPLDLTLRQDCDPMVKLALGGTETWAQGRRLEADTPVPELSGYEEGQFWVQDLAATLPARLLPVEEGRRVLDMCAAPGGKTLQLADKGGAVTALDRSRPRVRRLADNLERVGYGADIVVADGTSWTSEEPFDAILLDAPCSALGTLRRHPEGAWIKTDDDIARFASLQAKLLAQAGTLLKPGGTLVYCVCTLTTSEGVDVVEAFLGNGEFGRVPILPEEVPGFETAITEAGDLLTRPDRVTIMGGSDAFYVARLVKPD